MLIVSYSYSIACDEFLTLLGRGGRATHFSDKIYSQQLRETLKTKAKLELARRDIPSEISKQFMARIDLPLDELYMNALEHANRFNPEKKISVKIEVKAEKLILEISDESGRFFNAMDPNDPVNKNRLRAASNEDLLDVDGLADRRAAVNHVPFRQEGAGGRGVFLSQSIADNLQYVPHVNEAGKVIGTTVRIFWDFPPSNSAKPALKIESLPKPK